MKAIHMQRQLQTCVRVMTLAVVMTQAQGVTREVLLSRPVDDLLLEQHNIFRQDEKASNIFKMHWNDSVAAAAERWASQCNFKHQLIGKWGENLYYSSGSSEAEEKATLLTGLELWHDEKLTWRYSSDSCGAACHYTQMVWYSTTSVGCSHRRCPVLRVGSRAVEDALLLVCFYYPRGNWIGDYPYKRGSPCSGCGSDSCHDGLCVDVTSFSSYHKNEVKTESSWGFSYDSRGQKTHHTERSRTSHHESALNVTRSSPRHRSHHHVRHSASRHQAEQHDVRQISPRQQEHRYRSASRETALHVESHSSEYRKPAELQQREVTYASGGSALRELERYTPSRSARPSHTAASSRQDPRQAQYARAGIERAQRLERERYAKAREDRARSRRPSPLDVLRADNHWCRDRLPSCTTWIRQCSQSKAVFISCPRTCGQCNKDLSNDNNDDNDDNKDDTNNDSHDLKPTPLRDQRQSRQQLRQQKQQQRRQQQQKQPHRQRSPPNQRSRQQQRGENHRQQTELQHQRSDSQKKGKKVSQKQKGTRGRDIKAEERRRQRLQRKQQRQEKRRLRLEEKRQQRRRRLHRKFKTVDRRAENLADDMRRIASNSGRCEDDPRHTRSCPFWVEKGFCINNELLGTVYCRRSCGAC
ncbi:uncharacterized protein [Littorina saxatilis]|uniref:uncharacterized protein n=1 Tax=Littorina saxatilis TaxID=31220 RepID=UPI0038B698AC